MHKMHIYSFDIKSFKNKTEGKNIKIKNKLSLDVSLIFNIHIYIYILQTIPTTLHHPTLAISKWIK